MPKRAGEINKETAFALSYFGAQEPEYLSDIRTRVSDMEIKQTPSVEAKISIKQAYSLMKEYEASTLCITDKEGYLQGLITMSNIAASDMDVYDNRIVSKAKTPYENIVKALEAKVICGGHQRHLRPGAGHHRGQHPGADGGLCGRARHGHHRQPL